MKPEENITEEMNELSNYKLVYPLTIYLIAGKAKTMTRNYGTPEERDEAMNKLYEDLKTGSAIFFEKGIIYPASNIAAIDGRGVRWERKEAGEFKWETV